MARIAMSQVARSEHAQGALRRCPRQAGFTLVEMLVVVTILALMAGLFAVGRTGGSGIVELKSTAAMAAVRLREARSRALLQQRDVMIVIDLANRQLFSADRNDRVSFGSGTEMQVFADAAERQRSDRFGVRFHPDGSSSGATLRLTQKGRGYEIRVHWLTGRVSVAPIG